MFSSRFLTCALLALFCTGAALGADALFTRRIHGSDTGGAARVGRVINNVGGAEEIPIFGASKAAQGYVPEVLGPDYFNYGFSRASPDVTNLLVSFELRQKSSKPIVIDLNQSAINDIGDVRNFIPFARDPQVKALLQKQHLWRWYYQVPGLRYFGSFDWYLKAALLDRLPVNTKVVRGYSHLIKTPTWSRRAFDLAVAKRLRTPIRFGMDEGQRQTMLALIRSAPERKFIIVLSPVHKSYIHGATGEAQFLAKLADFQAEPNVQFLDFTRTDYPDRYFRDSGHLSPEGARAFSAQLRDAIETGVSKPARPEPAQARRP